MAAAAGGGAQAQAVVRDDVSAKAEDACSCHRRARLRTAGGPEGGVGPKEEVGRIKDELPRPNPILFGHELRRIEHIYWFELSERVEITFGLVLGMIDRIALIDDARTQAVVVRLRHQLDIN
ncbi:MAG: hypothetical protein O7D29_09980 [Gemmatimonadetes bacterium]|nr:hypothetical protein [Gemmatimonadota bacterium]